VDFLEDAVFSTSLELFRNALAGVNRVDTTRQTKTNEFVSRSVRGRPMTQQKWTVVALALAALALPGGAAAQTMNPTQAQFIASPDHNATNGDGTAVVDSYRLDFYLAGASSPFQTVSIGKPTPDGTNIITVNLDSTLVGWPVAGTNYVADVAAVGPGGATASPMSNTFAFSPSCTYALSTSAWGAAAAGGSSSINVTAGTGCTWAATSSATWLTITSGATGTGNGAVAFSASANTSSSLRTATLTIAGQTLSVSQAGTCGFSLSPTSQTVAASGGTGSANVTGGTGCTWAAVSGASWLTITAGGTGTGNGSVSFSASANTTTSSRNGALTIAGQSFTVTQPGNCSYSLSSSSPTIAAKGGTGTANVTTGTGCTWTATSSATWLTVTSGASGTGNGTVTFSAQQNKNAATRTANLTVAGQTLKISQPGTCTYTLSAASQNLGATGGTGTTNVTTKPACAWTATSGASWLTVAGSGAGSGNGTVSFTAAANPSGTARSATLTIAGQIFTVVEAGESSSPGAPGPPTNIRLTGN
jgi:hypothetical protein